MNETIYDWAKRKLKEERYLVTVDEDHPYWEILLGEWSEKGRWSPEAFKQEGVIVTATEAFRAMGRPTLAVYFFSSENVPHRVTPKFFLCGSDLAKDLELAAEWGAFL